MDVESVKIQLFAPVKVNSLRSSPPKNDIEYENGNTEGMDRE